MDKTKLDKFSVVVPLFNEALNIKILVEEIFESLKTFKKKFELILVNDCSTDSTFKELQNLKKKYIDYILVINNKKNIGQSFSLVKGIIKANNKIIVTIDGDCQNNPKDIPVLLNKYFLDKEISLVGGIREKRKDSFLKITSSRIANNVRNLILKDNCTDTGCSLKVFDKDTFMSFPTFNGMHRFLPALFSGYGKKTFFINVDHRARIHGYSKYGTFGRLFRGVRDIFKVVKIIKKFKRNSAN
jgi:dolichol-phosphate mannosyltransferase